MKWVSPVNDDDTTEDDDHDHDEDNNNTATSFIDYFFGRDEMKKEDKKKEGREKIISFLVVQYAVWIRISIIFFVLRPSFSCVYAPLNMPRCYRALFLVKKGAERG